MATTEPRNECANSSTSTPSKSDRKKCAAMPARMTLRGHVFEKAADFRHCERALARTDHFSPAAALLIRPHQMLALQKRGAGPAPLPRRSGELDQGLDLRVVLGLDGLHSMPQVRNPAKMSPRSAV